MKIVIQRCLESSVIINHKKKSEISSGLCLFVCLESHDNEGTISKAVTKILSLRIFEDENKKMNLNILQVKKQILSISQFTLSWDGKKGNRPSFDKSMAPEKATIMFNQFNNLLSKNCEVKTGEFGKDMKVHLINDGPVTFTLTF